MSGYPGAVARARREKQKQLDKQLNQQHAQQQNAFYQQQPSHQPIMQQAQQARVHPNGQAVIRNRNHGYHPSTIIPPVQPVQQQQHYSTGATIQVVSQPSFVPQSQNPQCTQPTIVHNPYTQNQPAMYQQKMMVDNQPQAQYSGNYQQVHAQQPIYNNGNQQLNAQSYQPVYASQNPVPSKYQEMKVKYQQSGGMAQPNQPQYINPAQPSNAQPQYQAEAQPNYGYNQGATTQQQMENEGQGAPSAFNPNHHPSAQSDSSSNQGVYHTNDQTSDMSNASAPSMYPDVKKNKNPYY